MSVGTDLAERALRTRSLRSLLRAYEPDKTPYRRITPSMADALLRWAATLPDETILDMRDTGPVKLRWIRDHQPNDSRRLPDAIRQPARSERCDTSRGAGEPSRCGARMGVTPGRDLLARHIDCIGVCDVWIERDTILAIEDELTRLGRIERAARAAMRAGWFTTNDAGDQAAEALRGALNVPPVLEGATP